VTNYAIYHKGTLRSYSNSGDMGIEGWQLIGNVNQFVECSLYESQYKSTYPQIETVLVFKQQIISAISVLPENDALPVGTLFGKEIGALNGEIKRFLCIDFVPQTYIANKGYIYAADAHGKYKTLTASGLQSLGKYKVARGAFQKLTKFDDLLLKNLLSDQILCIVSGAIVGSQTAFLKRPNSQGEKIGIDIVE